MIRVLWMFLVMLNHVVFAQNELKIIKVVQSECDKGADICRIQPRIVNKIFKDSVFMITIGTVANCAGISMVKSSYQHDTLNILYTEGRIQIDTIKVGKKIEITKTTQHAMCVCCFEFQFFIANLPKEPKYVKVNNKEYYSYNDKYKIYPVKFDIIKGDTFNLVDKYGLKQGNWNRIDEDDREFGNYKSDTVIFMAFYVDDIAQKAELRTYFSNGQLETKIIKKDSSSTEEIFYENGQLAYQEINYGFSKISHSFYKNGFLKRVCIRLKDYGYSDEQLYYENGSLKKIINRFNYKEFYPNGELKYDRVYSKNKDNIWAKYYYDDGKIMSIFYVKSYKDGRGNKKSWSKYFDKKGKRVTKEFLIIKDMEIY